MRLFYFNRVFPEEILLNSTELINNDLKNGIRTSSVRGKDGSTVPQRYR